MIYDLGLTISLIFLVIHLQSSLLLINHQIQSKCLYRQQKGKNVIYLISSVNRNVN